MTRFEERLQAGLISRAYRALNSKSGRRVIKTLTCTGWGELLLTSIWIGIANPLEFFKVIGLRCLGRRPQVVLVTLEGDGRFHRLFYDLKDQHGTIYFLKVPLGLFLSASIIFDPYFQDYNKRHATRGTGRYIDSFDRYFHQDNFRNRQIYRKFCEGVVRAFSLILGASAFVNASADDTYCIELVAAAKDAGLKWILCEREGTQTVTYSTELGKLFQKYNPLRFDAMFGANALHVNAYRVGHKEPSKAHVEILGELRSDKWVTRNFPFKSKRYAEWSEYKHRVLFLTFGERNYIEPMFHKHVEGNWLPLLHDIEDALYTFSRENPTSIIFYKMGHTEDFHQTFLDRCAAASIQNIVPLDRTFPCEELVDYCDVIIGFQSTATLECLFTTKPVLYTSWKIPPEIDMEKDILPLHLAEPLIHVHSSEELLAKLNDSKAGRLGSGPTPDIQARRMWLDRYFNQADGGVAERLLSRIHKILRSTPVSETESRHAVSQSS